LGKPIESLAPEVTASAPPSPRVLRPGFAPGREVHARYAVGGGEGVLINLRAGDEVTVVDPQGLQAAVIFSFGDANQPVRSGLLCGDFASAQSKVEAWLQSGDARATALGARLQALKLVLQPEAAQLVLAGEQRGGSQAHLRATQACRMLLLALPHPLGIHGQRPATALRADITRANAPLKEGGIKGLYRLPDALADARLDFQVNRRNAHAYEIKAGEYVQIIDPYGRQCSDFIAFDLRALDRGLERFIDSTVSRSMTRTSYPRPGLFDKFYDQDMRPLLRVVQDTCGRHDTFALACTARGYEDSGFPGHNNCSDNISQAAASHGVAARQAWPAVNLFFNTGVTHANAIVSDEGWSRPGDFVLMRAETDLLCVSTACPDDTTAINGWNPTDVHVRVYPAQTTPNEFKRAVAYRMTPDAEPQMTRETGFHPRTSALTRHYRQAREYWVPTQFTEHGPAAEYAACRNAVTVMDMSQLCKFEITGPDSEALLQRTMTRDVRKMSPGQVLYSLLCYPHGGVMDDGTLFRFGVHNFRWVCGNPLDGDWLREQARAFGLDAYVRSATDELHNMAVQGPRSRELLASIIWTPDAQPMLTELKWFRSTVARLHDREGAAVVVSRTGFTGELGYEIFCHPKDACALWDAVSLAGAPLGLVPMGSDALEMLRIEAGLAMGGNEFSSETDPFEAGIGFAAPASKTEDYVGKAAIDAARNHSKHVLVGFKVLDNEAPAHGDGVYVGQARVGTITSAIRSPAAAGVIALARVAPQYAAPGSLLEVGRLDGYQKRLLAQVHALPFYDPNKERIRA
jgi:aminomethyltransferase